MPKNIEQLKKEFIYIPSLNLYFSKERFSFRVNWYETHRLLQNQESKMPTIPEYLEFLKHLKNSKDQEEIEIYKDTLEPGNYFRGEWLDADFKVKDKKIYINYNHVLKEGKLIPMNSEVLEENTLMRDLKPGISLEDWIFNPTKQGLPKKDCKKGSVYYWHPRVHRDSVARLVANSVLTYLSCGTDPANSNLRVRIIKNNNFQ